MGESPDRSNRTAGAEEQEAEQVTAGTAASPAPVEPAEPAAPTPTDSPTRTLRPRADESEEAEAEAEAATESQSQSQSEAAAPDGESPVESATRVLRAPVTASAPKANAKANAEAEAEPESESESRSDADTRSKREKPGETREAEKAEAPDAGATRVLRTLPPEAAAAPRSAKETAPEAAAEATEPDAEAATPADAAKAARPAGVSTADSATEPLAEAPDDDADAEPARPAGASAAKPAADPRTALAGPAAGASGDAAKAAASRPGAGPAAARPAAEAPADDPRLAGVGSAIAVARPGAAAAPATPAADSPEDDTAPAAKPAPAASAASAAAQDDAEPEDEAPDEAPEEGPEPEAKEPPAARGGGRASIADEETRPMSALPPIPPPPGPRPRPSAPFGPSAPTVPSPTPGFGPAPERGAPAGATAVAESPETTVEAMEVLAGLSARPMTPMRVALRRVRLWGTLLVLLALILGTVQALRPLPSPTLRQSAATGYSFQGATLALDWPTKGQAAVAVPGLGLMGKSGSGSPVPLASVTKMMTAYIVLRDHPLKKGQPGPAITVDQQAVNDYNTGRPAGESVQKVTAGEKLSEHLALQMLMIPSANNVARLLGRWDAGTDAAFVQKMQATAAQLGMDQSTYTDPSGLDATTRSTAADQLKLATAAMADPVFREVVGTQQFNSPLNGPTPNTNTLVGKYGVIGIKTGSSTAALGNLVWAAQQNVGGVEQMIVGVTLSQPAIGSGPGQGILDQVLANSKKLVLSAEQALQGHTIAHKGDVVGYVDDGLGGRTAVVATQDVQVTGWSGLSVDVSLQPLSGRTIPHGATAGTVVGQLVVGSGATARTVPVALQGDLAAPGLGAKLIRLG